MTGKSPTGRTTLSLPEPQRIPGSEPLLKETSPPIVGIDYTRIEKRVIAHMSGPKHREHSINGSRPLTFEEAKNKYPHRFTMEHVPLWANKPVDRGEGKYPGPHYTTDLEWYNNSEFPDRGDRKRYCRSTKQTYPLGKWLDKPFSQMRLGDNLAKVLSVTEKQKPDPRAIKRAERRRQGRLAQFEITPVMEAIRNHTPEPKKTKVVPTVAEMLHKDINGKGKPKGRNSKGHNAKSKKKPDKRK